MPLHHLPTLYFFQKLTWKTPSKQLYYHKNRTLNLNSMVFLITDLEKWSLSVNDMGLVSCHLQVHLWLPWLDSVMHVKCEKSLALGMWSLISSCLTIALVASSTSCTLLTKATSSLVIINLIVGAQQLFFLHSCMRLYY